MDNVRIGLIQLRAGVATVEDITEELGKAEELSYRIEAELEMRVALEGGSDSVPYLGTGWPGGRGRRGREALVDLPRRRVMPTLDRHGSLAGLGHMSRRRTRER